MSILDVNLSDNFTFGEMVRTSHRHINNMPGPDETARLKKLCQEFLEPIREKFGPLWITSGFRCRELNEAIGGSSTSAHVDGCAADFVPIVQPPLLAIPTIEIVDWVVDHSGLDFDQIIDEYSSTANWIHIGMLKPGWTQPPRREALTMRQGRYFPFDRSVVTG